MKKIIEFSIGNINAEIYCNKNIKFYELEQYDSFPVFNRNEKTINIKVIFMDINVDLLDYDIIYQGKTHFWGKNKSNHKICFGFGSRYQIIDKDVKNIDIENTNIWYALSDEKLCNVDLYINKIWLLDQTFSKEFVYRPWIQRLIVEKIAWDNVLVMHGAACSINGNYCLFLGNSGVGKSTMCSLLEEKGHKILADDRIIISYGNNIMVNGTPWNTKNPHFSKNAMGIVNKIFFLNHGLNNKITPIDSKRIMQKIFRQIYKPLTCDKNEMIKKVLMATRIISTKVPGYELIFKPTIQIVTLLEEFNNANDLLLFGKKNKC